MQVIHFSKCLLIVTICDYEFAIQVVEKDLNSSDFIDINFVAQSATKATFLASAIRKCGGNVEKGNLLYTAYGSNGQVLF